MHVPRIYGFSSIAPVGQYTAPRLEKYFRSVQKPPIEIFWGTLDTFLGELQRQLAVASGQR